jgi:AcrR family transcriptional regulator
MRKRAELRDEILAAARAEFARHGLAGARIDRIATSASASKERLYSYYGDKAALFQAVLDLNTAEFFAAVRLDADDVCAEAQGGPTLTPSGRPIAWCGLDAPSMANGRSGR